MWKDLNLKNVNEIKMCVGEFQIWMTEILPYGKMKIKVYEGQDGTFKGYTDVQIKRKFDGSPESAVGFGNTIEEALEDTMNWFNNMLDEDYPEGLSAENIDYTESSDF